MPIKCHFRHTNRLITYSTAAFDRTNRTDTPIVDSNLVMCTIQGNVLHPNPLASDPEPHDPKPSYLPSKNRNSKTLLLCATA